MPWSNSSRAWPKWSVSKLFKAAEPDFVVKTQTAIMGVRGTDFGVRIYPNSTDILNFEGLLQVGNILPDVSQLFRRAFKVAYSFGSGGAAGQHWVFLKTMQGTTVRQGKPPSPVFTVTPAMKNSFMQMFSTSGSRGPGGGGAMGGRHWRRRHPGRIHCWRIHRWRIHCCRIHRWRR